MSFIPIEIQEGAIALYHEVVARIWVILKAVYTHPEMLWLITPVVISMVLISYYFGKYKKEELGWNTAFGNSIVMLFACVDLFRHLHGRELLGFNTYTMLVAVVMGEGVLLMLLNFLHALPKSFAFALSSGMTVNSILIFLVVIVYGQVQLDYITALAVTALSLLIILLLKIMQFIEWPSEDEEEEDNKSKA
ncbi:MAG: hypothetical protein KJ955_03970 [Nanoarchaeota archaeon]|nr:hypothetical protein [Nanoarchaeota archaeon]